MFKQAIRKNYIDGRGADVKTIFDLYKPQGDILKTEI